MLQIECKISRGYNPSFVTFVSKIDNSIGLNDYRSILLIEWLYETIYKILSNTLRGVIPTIIDGSQSTFIESRGLLDNMLMANEVVEDARCTNKRCIIVKVDFGKIYNLARWATSFI